MKEDIWFIVPKRFLITDGKPVTIMKDCGKSAYTVKEEKGVYTMADEIYEKKAGNGCVAELLFEGRMTRRQLEFVAGSVKKYKIHKTTLNRCGNVVVWNLSKEILEEFVAEAGEAGIDCGSAYFPRPVKVLCAPLSGVEEGECFDVSAYAGIARRWLGQQAADTPFTVYFSNRREIPREGNGCDLIFCAMPDGLFEVWARDPAEGKRDIHGGALFRLAERMEPGCFLSYIKAGFAICGQACTAEKYRSLFWRTMADLPEDERRPAAAEASEIIKTGNGNFTCGPRVVKQKQEELYAACYHPLGGVVNVAFWQRLLRSLENVEDVEIRLDFRMNIYVCNLLAEEVGLALDSMSEGAFTAAEASLVHPFCGLCQEANCDAQMFEHVLLKEIKKLGFGEGVMPAFTVAGCPKACGEIRDVALRFLAEAKAVGETGCPSGGLMFTVEEQNASGHWRAVGRIPQRQLTEYLIALGALPQSAGMGFEEWRLSCPGLLEKVTSLYAAGQ